MPDPEHPDLYLASTSPRRHEILQRMGVRFETLHQGVDEAVNEEETPEVFVVRLALEKARAGLASRPSGSDRPVLGADTAVVLEDEVLGKPGSQAEAAAMLQRLAGRSHRVLTGVALVDDSYEATRLSLSTVTLRPLLPGEVDAYWRSGEPVDKAGGYGIQGRGGVFIEQLEGSYTGVMGLPMFETHDLLTDFGIDYQVGWSAEQ
ncbi:septum formation inhibitor Maf [Spiribacter sp. 2438]|uniref:Maf family protein n=1 Tax=Spiribacter sp. 2438 TaxID=2666185 RepID=UPI0012AFD239|nr:nucleoside triphosphate pyrophosphatase [Spiribacter sp. 2438]QGM22220.1 septum formation inhibitor Maf [Spiribacter sp. 2438]